MQAPWAIGDFPGINKLPVAHIFAGHSKIIPHRRGDIQPGPLVQIGPWPLVPEDILPMVRAEWATVFPLCISDAALVADRQPAPLANRSSLLLKRLAKPRDHLWHLGLGFPFIDVVEWQGHIEGILPGNELPRQKISTRSRIRIVVSPKIVNPTGIPRTFVVGHRVVDRRFLTHPEDCRDDIFLPRISA